MKKSNKKSRRLTKEDLRILRELEALEATEAETDDEAWEILVPKPELLQRPPISKEDRKVNKIILKRILDALQSDDESQAA